MNLNDTGLVWSEIAGFLPHLLAAVAILILGWLGAWIVRALFEKGLQKTRVDERLARWGLRPVSFSASGKPISWAHTAGTILYFFLMLFVLIAFFDALQLTDLTQPINRLLQETIVYLPRLLGAAALLVLAWLAAQILKLLVLRGLGAVDLDSRLESAAETPPGHHASETIANVVFWVVLLFFLPAVLRVLELEGAVEPLTGMFTHALSFVPDLFAAAAILLVGWVVARMVRAIFIGFTEAMGVNNLAGRLGITRALGGQRVSVILGTLAYVVVLIPVVVAAVDALHIDAISTPAIGALTTMVGSVPYLFGSLLILAVAFVVGRLLADFTAGILRGLGFDSILHAIGLAAALPSTTSAPPAGSEPDAPLPPPAFVGGKTPSEIGGMLVMVFVMVFAAMEAAEILGFENLSTLISRFVGFLAQVVVAVIIAGIGLWLAGFTRRVILSGGRNEGTPETVTVLLANLARYAIIAFALALGLQQMGIGREIVVTAFALVLGSICLALAISFGLGSRDLAQRTVEEWSRKLRSGR